MILKTSMTIYVPNSKEVKQKQPKISFDINTSFTEEISFSSSQEKKGEKGKSFSFSSQMIEKVFLRFFMLGGSVWKKRRKKLNSWDKFLINIFSSHRRTRRTQERIFHSLVTVRKKKKKSLTLFSFFFRCVS